MRKAPLANTKPLGPFDPLHPRGFAVGLEPGNAMEPHPGEPVRLSGSTKTERRKSNC